MTNPSRLMAEIEASPDDWAPRLRLADWLEERGDRSSEVIRLLHELLRKEVHDPTLQSQLQALLDEGVTCPGPRKTTQVGGELAMLPPGTFLMGDNSSGRATATISHGFWIGRTPVTQQQWSKVLGQRDAWTHVDPSCPVTHVDWNDANEFCVLLSERERSVGKLHDGWKYRLPTEAEWEYACRAGTVTTYFFGEEWERLTEFAWFNRNTTEVGEEHLHPVASRKPNPWGLFDMYGNVLEWCLDGFQYEHKGGSNPFVEPSSETRVTRGGDFRSADWCCESGSRFEYMSDSRRDDIGFRIALCRTLTDS